MRSSDFAHNMKSHFFQRQNPTKVLTDSFHGRVKAIKNANASGSHTDSDSDMGATGDARDSCTPDGESQENSFDDGDVKGYEEEDSESDVSSQAEQNEATFMSFGALVKAQASFGKRNRSNDGDGYTDGHGSLGENQAPREFINGEALERRAGKKDTRDFLRPSKHAPAELSSKKAVSRKREVVPTQKVNHRDPRFEPFSGAVDEQKTKKNYSFLDTYRDSEISELKSVIRKTKDSESKEKLKRALLSMETRKKAQKRKEQQQEVLRKHRKQEKGLIEQGKRPFYLKKADQKRMALVERFEGMKGKQVNKVIERRRKRKAAKERKGMPHTRRGSS